MHTKLRDLGAGSTGIVDGFSKADPAYRDRLLSMGLTKGTSFEVIRVAPLGDPVEIRLRGFSLSLRKDEADAILVRRA